MNDREGCRRVERWHIATVEYDAGEYWIRLPGIEKAGSHAKRPEDICPARPQFPERVDEIWRAAALA